MFKRVRGVVVLDGESRWLVICSPGNWSFVLDPVTVTHGPV